MNQRIIMATVLIVGVSGASRANAAPQPQQGRDGQPQRVVLTVHPAAPARPALKYALLHESIDQKPGNAALAYERVRHQLTGEQFREDHKKLSGAWLNLPLDELPLEEMGVTLERYADFIDQLERASLCRRCDWQTNLREEGISTLLTHLSPLRDLARLLAAQIRYEIATGQLEQALRHLRVGFTMAQHLGKGETLIEGLVGLSVGAMMLERVRELMQQEDAPNLYWPLTDMPTPFLDVRRAVQGEKWWLYATYPRLLDARRGKFAADQWHTLFENISELVAATGSGGMPGAAGPDAGMGERVVAAAAAAAAYPTAKQYLIRYGRTTEEVEAMPVAEVLVRTMLDGYEAQRDDLFKWYVLPYWQGEAGLARFEAKLTRTRGFTLDVLLARILLTALSKARLSYANFDRQIALARCVAMLRLHAGAHDGQLPASLADVDNVVEPIDPVTGKPFNYRVEDGKAVIDAPAPSQAPRRTGYVYEVLIAAP